MRFGSEHGPPTAVVTGATRGLGLALSRGLVKCDKLFDEPMRVVVTARDGSSARGTVAALQREPPHVWVVQVKEAERLRGGKDGGGEEVPEAVLPGDVLAVFGEIVEDPNLVVDPGGYIDDGGPAATRSRMRSLNREVMVQFLDLVNKLVKDPTKNKESREELGRLLADMVEECNRYRDHQARELLIERLEQEQNVRKAMLEQLRKELRLAAESSLN